MTIMWDDRLSLKTASVYYPHYFMVARAMIAGFEPCTLIEHKSDRTARPAAILFYSIRVLGRRQRQPKASLDRVR